jgi:PAS domain S-box-containing protein
MDKDDLRFTALALRERAEKILKGKAAVIETAAYSMAEMVKIVHELQVHQIEVELQNEELGVAVEELTKAREQAEKREKSFLSLLRFQSEGLGLVDQHEVFEFVNPAAIRIFEAEDTGLTGTSLNDYLSPDQIAKIGNETGKRMQGIPSVYELKIITGRGNLKHLHVSVTPKFDDDNKYVGAYGIFNDITERKEAELRLLRSEATHRKMIANISDVIVIIDKDQNIRYKSENVEKYFGWCAGDLTGRNAALNLHPEDLEMLGHFFGSLVQPNSSGKTECRYRCKDGSYKWIEFAAINLFHDPEIQGFLGNYHDISQRKRAMEAVAASEMRFRQVVEQSNDVVWEVDHEGLYTYVSSLSVAVYGYLPIQMIGKLHFYDLHPEAERDQIRDAAFEVFRRKECFKGLISRIFRLDGTEVVVSTNGIPMLDSAGNLTGYRGIDSDITDRAKSDKKIRDLNTELENKIEIRTYELQQINNSLYQEIEERKSVELLLRKARYEAEQANLAKSEFLSRMSHELRTPMNSILGFAQLMDLGELSSSQKKGVSHILRSGKHLLGLINEVLDISSIEAGHLAFSLKPVLVEGIILEMINSLQPQADKKEITIVYLNPSGPRLFIDADPLRLKQVLLNLLNNAIKYNKNGGIVSITTELRQTATTGVATLRISISDSGQGIKTADIDKIFSPFERIGAEKTQTEGTGLGLTIVKKLMDAMGGQIGVESLHGKGSIFWIEMKVTESDSKLSEGAGNSLTFETQNPG